LTNGFVVAHPMTFHYKIVGTKGSAMVLRTDETVFMSYSDNTGGSGWERKKIPFDSRSGGPDSTTAMIEAFIDAVQNGKPSPVDSTVSFDMTLPGILGHQSAQKGGQRLTVRDPRDF
jgi:predicted dehydrogenase